MLFFSRGLCPLRVVGSLLAASIVALPPILAACSCDPGPPPTTARCDASGAPTVEALRLSSVLGPVLTDGDPLPVVGGPQGGQHLGLVLELDGSGFGDCVEVAITVEGNGDFRGGVRARATDTGVRTSQIVIPPRDTNGCHDVTASAYGLERSWRLGTCAPMADAGIDARVPMCGDGIVDVGEACDDGGSSALCRDDCTYEGCDGVEVVGERCFLPAEARETAEVLAMATRTATAGEQVAVAVRLDDGTFALELRSASLEPIEALTLPFEPGLVLHLALDSDAVEDDLVLVGADGARMIEARAAEGGALVLGSEVALDPPLGATLPVARCQLRGDARHEVLVASGPAMRLLPGLGEGDGAPWQTLEEDVLALACADSTLDASVYVASSTALSVFVESGSGRAEPFYRQPAFAHPHLVVMPSLSAVLATGDRPELVTSGGERVESLPLGPITNAAWVLRDGVPVLALLRDVDAPSTALPHYGVAGFEGGPAIELTGPASHVVGLADGAFVMAHGTTLTRVVPGG